MARRRFRMQFNRDYNIKRVIAKIFVAVIVLYVGGTILTELGSVMNGTTSPFYKGLTLIGWTVNANGQITATNGTGILTVVGIVAIASVVLEFVKFKL